MPKFLIIFAYLGLLRGGIAYEQLEAINPESPLTVCQVLHDLQKYRGKIIEVRGEWQGRLLEECPEMKSGTYTWPSEIVLAFPESAGIFPAESSANWPLSFDRTMYQFTYEGAWATWEKLPLAEKDKNSVLATIVGRLDANPQGLVFNSKGPQGFGVQNMSPAQLVVVAIKNIRLSKVEKRKAKSPSEGVPVHGR